MPYRLTFFLFWTVTVVPSVAAQEMPSRPLPHPVNPGARFETAIERGTRTETGEPGPNYWQQWTDYDLHATLDPEAKRISGTAKIEYHNRAPVALPALALHLHQNAHAEGAVRNRTVEVTGGVEINRVLASGQELEERSQFAGPGYGFENTLMYVVLPSPLASGSSVTLEIEWEFQVPQSGMGRMGWSRDNLFHIAYWYPQMAVIDDVGGWQVDPYLGNAEMYAGYGSYSLSVTAPAGWLITGSGRLQNGESVLAQDVYDRLRSSEESDDIVHVVTAEDIRNNAVTRSPANGMLTWRFEADTLRDVAFSATRESLWDATRIPVGDTDGDGDMNYSRADAIYRESAPKWNRAAEYVRHSIDFLSRYTELSYPWPHMSAVEGGDIIGGGMEFPMLTLIGDYNQATDSALYFVTAHELAHMWVPMIVGVDERRRAWMDEGTTTFNENQARMEYFPGINHHEGDQANYINTHLSEMEGEMMRYTDFHYAGPARGIASYSKPSTLLVMLRELIGEEAFNSGYRTYLANWRYKHPQPWDFFNSMETAAGTDLDWFWHTWYYETWGLDQGIGSVNETDDGTVITIEDHGDAPMPVRLTISTMAGETIQREIPVERWFDGSRSTSITVQTNSPVTEVTIDASGAFPDLDRSDNVWRRR